MQFLSLDSDIVKGLFSDITPQWLMTMLKSLKEDDRCYYVATTLVSLGVVYFVKKMLSFKTKRLMNIEEAADEVTSNINEATNSETKFQADHIKLSSKTDIDDNRIPDSFSTSPEQETMLLSLSTSVHHQNLSFRTAIPESEIISSNLSSDFERSPLEAPSSQHKNLNSDSNFYEIRILSENSVKNACENLPLESSMSNCELEGETKETSKLRFEVLHSECFIPEIEILSSESSTNEIKIVSSNSSIPEMEILHSEPCISEIEISSEPCIPESKISSESSTPKIEISPESSMPEIEIFAGSSLPEIETSAGSSIPELEISSESSRNEIKVVPSDSSIPEIEILHSEPCIPEIQISSESSTPEIEISPESSMPEIEISVGSSIPEIDISSGSSTPEIEISAESSMPEIKISAGSFVPEIDISTRSSMRNIEISSVREHGKVPSKISKPEILPLETNNITKHISTSSPVTELVKLSSLPHVSELDHLPIMSPIYKIITPFETPMAEHKGEQLNETVTSTVSSLSDASSNKSPKTVNDLASTSTVAVLDTLSVNSELEVRVNSFVPPENTIPTNGLVENGESLTNSNSSEFSLDTIPLEMIYKILPMSMQ